MHLVISVILNLTNPKNTGFVNDYKPTPQPAAGYDPTIDFSVKTLDIEDVADIPRKCDVVVFTDKAEYIETLPFDDELKLYVIYIGEAKDVRNSFLSNHIYEVWPSDEDNEIRGFRFDRTLRNIKESFDGWLYENLLTTVNDSVPHMIWFKDLKGLHWRVNDAFCNYVNRTKDDCRGQTHSYIWGVPYVKGLVCKDSEADVIAAGKTCTFEEPVKVADGVKQFKVYKTPLYDRFGDMFGTTGVGHDITDFSNMGLELSLLVENIPIPIMICSPDWQTVRMNGVFMNTFGSETLIIDYKVWKKNYLTIKKVLEENEDFTRCECTVKVNNEDHIFILNEKRILDYFGNTSGWFCVFLDITEQRSHEKEILRMANTDTLTGLFNRRYLYEYIGNNSTTTLTLLYMDLDFFKAINDTYGHARGDEVLIKTAEFISEVFPEGIAARLGGDEYAVVLKQRMSEEEFTKKEAILQEKVLSLFRREKPGDLFVTISVGMMVKEGCDASEEYDMDAFLVEADKKMYEIKHQHHLAQPEMDVRSQH
ncbi:MAG: diguanylate cyclase [Lachnospiraceae bacterium]|nr:diguanylate cyclase [Lachnospiraceae bacterium]